jgi:hypothetical protein
MDLGGKDITSVQYQNANNSVASTTTSCARSSPAARSA